jgi:hypothetical protein
MILQELPDLPVPSTQPIPGPVDIVDGTRTAFASGAYTVGIVLCLLGVARLLYWLVERYPTSGVVNALHLGSSKVRAFLTGVIGLLVATLVEIGTTTGIDYTVLIGVIGSTFSLWWRPEPKGKAADVMTVMPPPPPVNVPR